MKSRIFAAALLAAFVLLVLGTGCKTTHQTQATPAPAKTDSVKDLCLDRAQDWGQVASPQKIFTGRREAFGTCIKTTAGGTPVDTVFCENYHAARADELAFILQILMDKSVNTKFLGTAKTTQSGLDAFILSAREDWVDGNPDKKTRFFDLTVILAPDPEKGLPLRWFSARTTPEGKLFYQTSRRA